MVKKNILFYIILIITLLNSCFSANKLDNSNNSINIKELVINKNIDISKLNMDYIINKVTLQDSILNVDLSYSGDCGEPDFELFFNGNYEKSFPPQATFYLKHKSNKKKCNENINKILKFNISKAKYYKGNIVYIKLHSYNEIITYKY